MYKKLNIYIILSLFLLSGCGGGGSTTPSVTSDERTRVINDQKYEFIVSIPREWEIIEKKDFEVDKVPPETVIVFRNNVKNEDFTANVSVMRSELQETRETLDYANRVITRQKTGLYNYKEIKRELVKIKIGEKEYDTYIIYFEGKKDAASPLIRFIQTFAVKDKVAYIVLGAYSPIENENNVKTVEDIVKSFIIR